MPQNKPFTPDQVARYARHLILPEVGGAGQRKLLNTSVLLLGAGGLGSPAALYLPAAGAGKVGALAFAAAAASNPQRQIPHGPAALAGLTVDWAAARIPPINP